MSAEDRQQVRRRTLQGWAAKSIAEELGRSQQSVHSEQLRQGIAPSQTANRLAENLDMDICSVADLASFISREGVARPVLVTMRRHPKYVLVSVDEWIEVNV